MTQAEAIETAARALEEAARAVRAIAATQAAPAPAPAYAPPASAPTPQRPPPRGEIPVAPIGRHKGKILSDVPDNDLRWLHDFQVAGLQDPAKAKYHASTTRELQQTRDEMQRRRMVL